MLTLFIIAAVLAVVVFVVSRLLRISDEYGKRTTAPNKIVALISAGLGVIALLFLALGSFYTQDERTAVVEKSITGTIVGQSNTSGFHFKPIWVDIVEFNIGNQPVVFAGAGESDNNGNLPNGPQITVQDADGVSSNVDVSLRYSIRPDAVTDVYRDFRDEENFKKSFIEQDVRSVVRLIPTQYTTIDLLTKRGELETAIVAALEDRWADDGVSIDSISLQEIRVPDSVRDSYAAAQQAQINVTKEQANLEATQVSAQQKVVQAQAEADANALLNSSLTPAILQQRYLDTLAKLAAEGNLVITDGTGSQVLVQR